MIFIDTITNETTSKQIQQDFNKEFYLLSKELAPIVAKFMVDNNIPVTVAVYFFGGLIKDSLEVIPNESSKQALKEVIVKYINK